MKQLVILSGKGGTGRTTQKVEKYLTNKSLHVCN